MQTTKSEIKEEAINRIKKLIDKFNLNKNVLKHFKEGEVYYSYLTANGFMGSVDTICNNSSYEQLVNQFEKENAGYLVYHAIETVTPQGKFLSLLYVGDDKEEWESERLENNYIISYVANMNDPDLSEFGDIAIERFGKSGALIRTDI